jgi:hypothetical protein
LEMFPEWKWGPMRPGPRRKFGRDQAICEARQGGQPVSHIANEFRLSRQRIYQILADGGSRTSTSLESLR